MLFQEKSGEPDGDRPVQRTKNANHRDLLHFHSKIAEDKRSGVEDAHAQNHPAHSAARKTHGLPSNKNRPRDKQRAGQANHPHGLHRANSRDDANPKQPNSMAKPTDAKMAQPMPRPLLRTASASFSSGVLSPPATITTAAKVQMIPAILTALTRSPLIQESSSVKAG